MLADAHPSILTHLLHLAGRRGNAVKCVRHEQAMGVTLNKIVARHKVEGMV